VNTAATLPTFSVLTDYPIAADSLDHLHPLGTMQDNHTSPEFIADVQRHFGSRLSLLDLGCAGGQLVRDVLALGFPAVGIEGSDWSEKHGRPHWPELGGRNLFTADITKHFTVIDPNVGRFARQFRIITLWDVLEHIAEEDLPAVFENVLRHLEWPVGLFIGTISTAPSPHDGVDLHVTRRNEAWWRNRLADAGFVPVEGVVSHWVRGDGAMPFCVGLQGAN
jgi:2-polyprenyl-3-methyl-5-hydroxy-6-metoxy-1,4-benzoquinol methylase